MIDFATLERAALGLRSFDAESAIAAIRAGNVQGELVAAEGMLDFVSNFWPDAKYLEDILKVVGVVIRMRDEGLWAPAEPEDPAMMHAAGTKPGGR